MTDLPAPLALAASTAVDRSPSPSAASTHPELGTLRGVLTLLVVWHHAILAYHPFAPGPGPSLSAMPFWRAFPVVDAERWDGALWAAAFNDVFFMSLMFLLAGLFTWPSLQRRGAVGYARARVLRLGVPFVVFALVLAPLSYTPSYLQTGATWSFSGFWQQWRALDAWPTGPAWFLSLLLVFDLVAVAVFVMARAWGTPWPRLARLRRSPVAIWLVLGLAAVALYVPMAQRFGAMRWTNLGPLTFQTSRVLLYAGFFAVGVWLGRRGVGETALASGGALARRAWLWLTLAAVSFYGNIVAVKQVLVTMGASSSAVRTADFAFAVACASISFAAIALALRIGRRGAYYTGRGDNGVGASLRRNAYGIYLLHYPAVSWLQYTLLDAGAAGVVKAIVVCAGAIAVTWLVTALLRRSRVLAAIL